MLMMLARAKFFGLGNMRLMLMMLAGFGACLTGWRLMLITLVRVWGLSNRDCG